MHFGFVLQLVKYLYCHCTQKRPGEKTAFYCLVLDVLLLGSSSGELQFAYQNNYYGPVFILLFAAWELVRQSQALLLIELRISLVVPSLFGHLPDLFIVGGDKLYWKRPFLFHCLFCCITIHSACYYPKKICHTITNQFSSLAYAIWCSFRSVRCVICIGMSVSIK